MYGPDESLLVQLREAGQDGFEIEWVDSNLSEDAAAAAMRETRAVILGGVGEFTVELASKCPDLRLIQTTSAGTDRLDKAALGEFGVKVSNNGGGNAVAVAEHTIALMVSVYRKLQLQFQSVQDGNWMGEIRPTWFSQAHELTGKTVGIIGLGRIGSRVAQRLQGWECDLIYDDIIVPDREFILKLGLRKVDRDELLETSDLVTLHVPLNRQTRGMISDREFDLMKPTAVLINACRGPVVDEAAFIRAMNPPSVITVTAGLSSAISSSTCDDFNASCHVSKILHVFLSSFDATYCWSLPCNIFPIILSSFTVTLQLASSHYILQ